ncbi:MAG: alkaline phosphatase D family protein [Nitriliruptorales bacterium]|nr:alkaline phosphatase D family protein [Nitriliruptorales bacterium]
MATMRRRSFLKGVGGTAAAFATAGVASRALAQELPDDGPFLHGVASGDPLPDAVVIWTRVTPTNEAVPGSGVGPAVTVAWEVARDPAFDHVVAAGVEQVTSATDHTVKVDVSDLEAGADHWYRFEALGHHSPVGRTRTAPAHDASPDCLRLGVVSCAEWEFGYFSSYRHLAERDDLDAILHLGDYIYEFGRSYGPVPSPGGDLDPPRNHEPPHEILTLADYRIRYGQYRSDPDLQALHAAHPFLVMYDDHEIANDAWSDGAEQHDESEGDFGVRQAAARQAWREWIPLRLPNPADPEQVHRRVRFGDLVDMWIIDVRRYRSEQVTNALVSYFTVDPAVDSPDRTMLGAEQLAWFLDGLATSAAAWKVVGNPVPLYPFHVGTELATALEPIFNPLAGTAPPVAPPLVVDDWNGYRYEQDVVLGALSEITDVVVLTGDYHEAIATDLPIDTSSYRLDGNSVGVEFLVPAVTSPGLSETLGLTGAPGTEVIDVIFRTNLATANPWVQYHEGFSQGYGVVEFTQDSAQYDFWFLDDRTDPGSGSALAVSLASRRGEDRLTEAVGPLPARERPPSPPVGGTGGGGLPATGGGAAAAALVAAGAAAMARGRSGTDDAQDRADDAQDRADDAQDRADDGQPPLSPRGPSR